MEKWKSIKNYEGYYEISSLGNVRSIERLVLYANGNIHKHKARVRKASLSEYRMIALSKDGHTKMYKISRIVAMHFLKRIDGKNIVNHKDGNKYNDNCNNLEWCTISENNIHAFENGLSAKKNKVSGVFYEDRRNLWAAYLYRNNKNIFVGRYKTEKEAIEMRRKKLEEHIK